MSMLQRMAALEGRARCTLHGPQSPTCLPNGGQSTTSPYVPPSLLRVPQRTGQSPSRHALRKSDCGAKRVVAMLVRMGRARDPGGVSGGHIKRAPFQKSNMFGPIWHPLRES